MSSLTCSICAEDFSTEPVSCPACNEYACRPCFQTYLLNEPLEPHCLFCRKVYPEHFVTEYTDPAYSKYRGNLLYDAERPHLEQDEPRAASYKDAKIRLSSCYKEMLGINQLRGLSYMEARRDLDVEILKYRLIVESFGKRHQASEPKRTHLPCPACPAHLTDGTCSVCKTEMCLDCHKIKSTSHVCDTNDVASIKVLHQEAKPCPNCKAYISKVDGCDQMWCTQCHVTFSWLTGLIEEGLTHNPHYYEWRRRNGTLGPNPHPDAVCQPRFLKWQSFKDCFSLQTRNEASNLEVGWLKRHTFEREYPNHGPLLAGQLRLPAAPTDDTIILPSSHYYIALSKFYNTIIHHRLAANDLNTRRPDNYIFRIKYLAGELDLESFKRLIEKADTTYREDTTLFQIHDMVFQAAAYIFATFRKEIKKTLTPDINIAHSAFTQLRSLFIYANTYLDKYKLLFNRPAIHTYSPEPYAYLSK